MYMGRTAKVLGPDHIVEYVERYLSATGWRVDDRPDLFILCMWNNLEGLTELTRQSQHPLLLIEDAGEGRLAVGPVFSASRTGCFPCYLARRRANGGMVCQPARDMPERQLVQAFRHLDTLLHDAEHAWQIEVDIHGHIIYHLFLPDPCCLDCSEPAPFREFDMESLVSSRIGLVNRIVSLPTIHEEMTAWSAIGSRTDALTSVKALNHGLAADQDRAQARTRAIGESIERYCAAFIPDNLALATRQQLDQPSLDPAQCVSYRIKLKPSDKLRWVLGIKLLDQTPVWVPACMVYLPYMRDADEPETGLQTSTGLAAGQGLDDAIRRAFAEIIERDVVMRAWRTGQEVESVEEPHFEIEGLHLARVPNDSGWEVAAAFIEHPEPPLTATGMAASLTLAQAIRRAVFEAVLSQVWVSEQLSSGATPAYPPRTISDHAMAHALRPELRASRTTWLAPARSVSSQRSTNRHWQDLIACEPEACAVDLTTPDIAAVGLSVVKVIIPGRVPLDHDSQPPYLPGSALPHPFG